MTTNNRITNRLIQEKSPYLLQHAYNPVDWYPWCDKAFDKAKSEDKPIFLSIGYSTCHWCHVMEHESFEDEEVAKLLNDNYIAIKVDREERPDLDNIYMTFCQALTGQGGWPLNVFLTPDKKPFYAGTYFPKENRGSLGGLINLLKQIKKLWVTKRSDIIESSEKIVSIIETTIENKEKQTLEKYVTNETYKYFDKYFDVDYGGFGSAPKFPTSHNLRFLLRYWKIKNEGNALAIVEKTLKSMYAGGIYDHIGYGFSRYSTDREWLIPHFEKMLYDNALLAITYIETYQVTGNFFYAKVAEEIFTYVMRDLTHPEGGFYSAEDADSEGVEGKFYVWTKDEILDALGKEDGEEFCNIFNISKKGNFKGKNIPNLIGYRDIEFKDEKKILQWKERLFNIRKKRIHPHKDDKILTSWNGMMIAAMAIGGKVLNNKRYIHAAEMAMDFILKNLQDSEGRLYARFRDGEKAYYGYLDDYAYTVWALIELYGTTYKFEYLQLAKTFNNIMLDLFWDNEGAGLYFYGKDAETLLLRPKEIYDGAIPSGNSIATMNILKLARILGDSELEEYVKKQFDYFGGDINKSPMSHTQFIMAFIFFIYPTKQVVVIGEQESLETKEMIKFINKEFLPQTISIIAFEGKEKAKLDREIEFIKNQSMVEGKTTAYICENFSCKQPIIDLKEFIKSLS